jgi:hypothetical protein
LTATTAVRSEYLTFHLGTVDNGYMKRRESYGVEQSGSAQQRFPVYMRFRSAGKYWRVTFRVRGTLTNLPRAFYFGSDDKLRDLFGRFGTHRMTEDVAALEFALRSGGGAVELMLGEAQLSKLKTPKRPMLDTKRRI